MAFHSHGTELEVFPNGIFLCDQLHGTAMDRLWDARCCQHNAVVFLAMGGLVASRWHNWQ